MIDDRLLYGEFLKYLKLIVSSENLLCVRSINIFKQKFVSEDLKIRREAIEQAWITYRYFVAVNSPCEISTSHIKRKELMRELAMPNINTFDKVEKSAMAALKVHFAQYIATKEYSVLNALLLKSGYQDNEDRSSIPKVGLRVWARTNLGISNLLKIS